MTKRQKDRWFARFREAAAYLDEAANAYESMPEPNLISEEGIRLAMAGNYFDMVFTGRAL